MVFKVDGMICGQRVGLADGIGECDAVEACLGIIILMIFMIMVMMMIMMMMIVCYQSREVS